MPKLMRVSCVNDKCSASGHVHTIAAGRQVAPGVTEKLGALVCDECGQYMWTEPI